MKSQPLRAPSILQRALCDEQLEVRATDRCVEADDTADRVLTKLVVVAVALVRDASRTGVLAVQLRPQAVDPVGVLLDVDSRDRNGPSESVGRVCVLLAGSLERRVVVGVAAESTVATAYRRYAAAATRTAGAGPGRVPCRVGVTPKDKGRRA